MLEKEKGRAWLHMSTVKVQQTNKPSQAVKTSVNSSASPTCPTSLHRKALLTLVRPEG